MGTGLRKLHEEILELFKKVGIGKPVQLSYFREHLSLSSVDQEELPRRIRELRPHGYDVPYTKSTDSYALMSATPKKKVADTEPIPAKLAVQVRIAANGRCQLCGKTIEQDGIKIVVDHRVPRTWGGLTERDNLVGICEPCNIAKRDYFASFDDTIMKQCMIHEETTVRIGELLKAFNGKVVSRQLLEAVGQDDEWPRRLRELRELGWKVKNVQEKGVKGKQRYAYSLISSKPWPPNLSTFLKQYRAAIKKKRQDERAV